MMDQGVISLLLHCFEVICFSLDCGHFNITVSLNQT